MCGRGPPGAPERTWPGAQASRTPARCKSAPGPADGGAGRAPAALLLVCAALWPLVSGLPKPPGRPEPQTLEAVQGQSVLLHCPVEPSTDAPVSWFRGSGDLQLLTYGTTTIIQDERFVVRSGLLHQHDWALQIKGLDRASDAGLYQCQTSEDPPQTQYYQLNVVEPQVHIEGAPDVAVRLGSALRLSCVVWPSADQFQFVFWYRDGRIINYDIPNERRGKIVVARPGRPRDAVSSSLQIDSARASDAGNYTCTPSGARPTSVQVHVLEANDKRLIMFQSDDNSEAAASSQSSSRAAGRAGGRAYALFVALLIGAAWLQLVGQPQSAVSLLLLALVGLLLGRLTDQPGRKRARAPRPAPQRRRRPDSSEDEADEARAADWSRGSADYRAATPSSAAGSAECAGSGCGCGGAGPDAPAPLLRGPELGQRRSGRAPAEPAEPHYSVPGARPQQRSAAPGPRAHSPQPVIDNN